MKKILLSVLIFVIIISIFLPIYDRATYDYDFQESSIQEIFQQYVRANPQKTISIIGYRQVTNGMKWEIKDSTDERLIGCVTPLWLVNPMLLKDEPKYGEHTFLYRKIIIITEKKESIHKFAYADEQFSFVLPEKIVVAVPKNSYIDNAEKYHIYDLSVIGGVLLYTKLMVCIGICGFLIRVIFKMCRHREIQETEDGSDVLA